MKNSEFQLINKPIIKKSYFELNEDFLNKDKEILLDIKNTVSVFTNECSDEAKVTLDLWIFKDKDFDEIPFRINILIEGEFAWNEAIGDKEEILNILLNQNAPAILYSYIRPVITSMTVEANISPLVIPIMDFTKND